MWEWKNDDPFGNNAPNENPSATGTSFKYNNRFPGQYYDQETGTFYNFFRDYDPSTGRYVESDPIGLKGGGAAYGYVGGSPLGGFDPLGLKCVRNGGYADCDTPGGPSFRVPVPGSWPAQINPGDDDYHYYAKATNVENCNRSTLWPELVNNPTPWITHPATSGGTPNNVTPPWLQNMANDMQPAMRGPDLNPVLTYLTVDTNTGQQIVVNVTQPGHSLWPGYTVRTIADHGNGSTITTYGEGLGWLQSDAHRAQMIRNAINNVWYDNQKQIAGACGCK